MRGRWGYVAIAVIVGVATGRSPYLWLFATFFIGYILFLLGKKSWICMVCFLLAFLYMKHMEFRNVSVPSHDRMITGVVTSTPVIDGDRLSFVVEENVHLSYRISSEVEKQKWRALQPGMRCRFVGEMKEPGVARNEGGFDYKQYLHEQQIHQLFLASSISTCENHPSFFQWLLSLRQRAVQHVQQTFPKEVAAFINALVYGDRQDMSSEVEDAYQSLGLVHLLAISGSHISLLAVGGYYVLLRMGITRQQATACLLVVVPLYMFFAGASASVVRAACMAMVALGFSLIQRRVSGFDALSIATIAMVIWDPYTIYDVGFQFSVVITAALLLSTTSFVTGSTWYVFLRVSMLAQIVAWPITLHYFGQISPYSLLLNLLYVPYLSFVILPLCMFALLLANVPLLATLLTNTLGYLLYISNVCLQWVDMLPFSRVTFGVSPQWLTILYTIVIIALFITSERWRSYRKYVIVLFCMLCIGHYIYPSYRAGSITFLDVGQGDCIVIELPYGGGVYMIDTGGELETAKEEWQRGKRTYTVGANIVMPYLRSRGIRTIDKLILTHGDQDHVGAAQEVITKIPVRELVVGEKQKYGEVERGILETAHANHIPVRTVKRGDTWQDGSHSFFVLSPIGTEQKSNDQSIVLYSVLGGKRWLFTGDLEEKGERDLLVNYPDLRVDVLKVGHHGSESSTTDAFLTAIQPKMAIISVGMKNRYGHPHQDVLNRLYASGIEVHRTDYEGRIRYTFSENTGTFQSFLTYDAKEK